MIDPKNKIVICGGLRMELKFSAVIIQNGNMDAAYVEIPYDIKDIFGKGRL